MDTADTTLESLINAYIIVNDDIKFETFPLSCLKVNKNSDFYYEDNYGMGACHWSVINHPREAFDRQLRDNVLWAQERLSWALENNKKEIPELELIIKTNGYTRLTKTLEKFRGYANDNSDL